MLDQIICLFINNIYTIYVSYIVMYNIQIDKANKDRREIKK